MAKRNRRLDIMQAAEKLFTSHRFHEITLDDVIHEAGVGKGTIYRYFRDKDDLFFQTAMGGFDELCELLKAPKSKNVTFTRQLIGACEKVSAFFRRRRALFRMMQTEESRVQWCKGDLRRQWMAQRRKLASAVAEVLKRGVEKNAIRDDLPPELLAVFLLGMLRTYAREMAGKEPDLRVVVDLFLDGAAHRSRNSAAKNKAAARSSAGGRT